MRKRYDVFISYRRQGGEQTAKIICDRLVDAGYHVFYDVEALRSGAFNTKLYSVIDECRDVIVVLSQNSLDRCSNENDWVRLEIAHALKAGKNVIPVFLRGFEFPAMIPEDIAPLRYQNGLEANSEFFDAFIDKLKLFLKSKPTLLQRISQNLVLRRTLPFLLALLIVLGVGSGAYMLFQNKAQTFPKTQEQKNIANEALRYIVNNLTLTNDAFGEVSTAYKACVNYLVDMNPVQYEEAVAAIHRAYGTIDRLDFTQYVLSANLSDKIDNTPINKADLVAVNDYSIALCESHKSYLLFIKQVIKEDSFLDTSTKRKILEIYAEMLELDALTVTYGINDLLLPVDSSFLTEFKQTYLPMFINLSFGSQMWLNDKDELKRLADSVYNQQLQQYNDIRRRYEILVEVSFMKCALLLIDIQNDYFPGGRCELFQPEQAAKNAKLILEHFRSRELPIFHIQHISNINPNGFFQPGTVGAEVHSSVAPKDTEKVLIKHTPNAFINTGLEQILREQQISQLIICGMMSHMCIDSGVRAAKDAGFDVMLAEDACTTKAFQWEGSQIPAQTVHKAFMASLSGTFARVLKTSEILAIIEKL